MVSDMSTPTLTAPDMTVGSLSAGVDALLGIELWRLPGTAEANLIDTLETVCRRLEFAKLLVLADFDSRGIAAEQDALSTAAFLRDRLRISPTDATARVRAARELTATTSSSGEVLSPALPATAAGMATGALSAQHAQVISQAIRRLPTGLNPTIRADAEKTLARHARDLDPAALAIVGRHLHARLDPDGALEDDKPSRRELSFRPDLDGTDVVRGRLDAEAAAIVRTAIDTLAQPHPRQRTANGIPEALPVAAPTRSWSCAAATSTPENCRPEAGRDRTSRSRSASTTCNSGSPDTSTPGSLSPPRPSAG